MERLILDTSALIQAERGRLRVTDLIAADDDVAIAAITAAELLTGVHMADPAHRDARHDFVEELLVALPIEPYDLEVARVHAGLLATTRRAGRQRGSHDLIIAATAVARGRTVVTTNSAGFDDLAGVSIRTG